MTKTTSFFLAAVVAASLMSTSAFADAKAGQKIYLKTLKAKFNMNGTKFAAEHTVAEWEELFANDAAGFIKEYGQRFPTAVPVLTNPSMKDKLQDIGDFAKEYGSDSGNVPSCG
jgi:opacity protein-like surface antigen